MNENVTNRAGCVREDDMSNSIERVTDKPKLLYVDDETDNLELFMLQFGKDFEITTCNGGDKALQILSENPNIDIC